MNEVKEVLENSTSLTFSDNTESVQSTFQDDEAVLVTLNMSFNKKFSIKTIREKFLQKVKDNKDENDIWNDMIEEGHNTINKNTMFYFMFNEFLDFMLQETDDEEFINEVKENMLFTEQSEILQSISERKANMNSPVIVERVPSNLSMSMCKCCISKEETNDKTDFSRDYFTNKGNENE